MRCSSDIQIPLQMSSREAKHSNTALREDICIAKSVQTLGKPILKNKQTQFSSRLLNKISYIVLDIHIYKY